MDTPKTALLYEADLEETVSELVQYRVIRQSYTLLLTRFWFHRDWGLFSFSLFAGIIFRSVSSVDRSFLTSLCAMAFI